MQTYTKKHSEVDKTTDVNKSFYKDALGWGVGLWLIGYILGFALFAFIPASLIGWAIMPIGILITLWVLLKKIRSGSFQYYVLVAIVWTLIAIVFDFLFLVVLLKPADGYYKLDVYIYYALTFVLPLVIGWYKIRAQKSGSSGM